MKIVKIVAKCSHCIVNAGKVASGSCAILQQHNNNKQKLCCKRVEQTMRVESERERREC